LAVVKVDVTTREISQLLLEIPSGQPLALEAAASGPGPEPSMPSVEEALTGVAALLHAPALSQPLFEFDRLPQYTAGCGLWLHAPPKPNMHPSCGCSLLPVVLRCRLDDDKRAGSGFVPRCLAALGSRALLNAGSF